MAARPAADWRADAAPVFVDTNILFYAYDRDAGAKRERAIEVLEICFASRRGRLSIQVLQEFSVNLWKHLRTTPLARSINAILAPYREWPVHRPKVEDVIEANRLVTASRISFWDAMIVVSARASGAAWLLTENLQNGQRIEGVLVRNPLDR